MTPGEIFKRYPYMLAGRNLGLDVPAGWLEGFATLCKQIDSLLGDDKRDFHWVQLKEKWGSARWYFKMKGEQSEIRLSLLGPGGVQEFSSVQLGKGKQHDSIAAQIRDWVNAAESQTIETCICCGQPAKVNGFDGYMLVLCDEHAQVRQGGGNLRIWFEQGQEEPVIMLDFDGVLHPFPGSMGGTLSRLALVEEVLREFPTIPVVISSSWREAHPLDDPREMFSKDIEARILGATPMLGKKFRSRAPRAGDEQPPVWERQWEIEHWMQKNRPVGAHWIAIDDMPHWFKQDCPNLLVTDPKHGFTKENQEQLRQMIRERMP